MNEIDDFELLHNVQIWIDENQGRVNSHNRNVLKSSEEQTDYSHNRQRISNQNYGDLNIFVEQEQHRGPYNEASIEAYKNNFNHRKGSTKLQIHNNISDINKLMDSNNLPRRSPQNSQRYRQQNDKQLIFHPIQIQPSSIHKNESNLPKNLNSSILSQANFEQNEYQQNIFMQNSNIQNKPNIQKQANNKSNIKPRGLKPLPKQFYLLKKFEAAHIIQQLNENSIYNFDYNVNDLQLKGSQYQARPSPVPQVNQQQNFGPQFLGKFGTNNKQTISDHKELLHFLKQKYQEEQKFVNEGQVISQKYDIKQKHFDVQNFDQYPRQQNKQLTESSKIQTLDISLVSEASKNENILISQAHDLKIIPPRTQELNKHRKLLSTANSKQKVSQQHSTLFKKNDRSRVSTSHQKSQQQETHKEQNEFQEAQNDLERIEEINNVRKSAGINQRLKPKKNQNNNSTHILLSQKNLQDHENMEKFLKIQKQIKAKYNDISITQRQQVKDDPYKYIVIRGNNSELVKRCLDLRNGDWQEISSNNTIFHLKWVPFCKGIRFDYLSQHGQKKMVNHFEYQDQISQKDTLFYNLTRYCEAQKLNTFDFHPITFVINMNQPQQLQEMDKFYALFNILEKNKTAQQGINHINSLIQSHSMFNSSKHNNPIKYSLTQSMFDGKNFWLIKPPDFNRGRGVQVFNTLEQLKKLVNDFQQGLEISLGNDKNAKLQDTQIKQQDPQVNSAIPPEQMLKNFTNLEGVPNIVKTNEFVIQKYLERPLLIQRRKFDIRLWVLLSHDFKCYLFKEGYIRTSSQEFDLSDESIEKPFIHLTNNAVQRFNENYGNFEEGNQLSFSMAQNLLEQDSIYCNFHELIQDQIKTIIVHSMKSIENKINLNNRKFCFEIFGYDFILDNNMKPWLIEVNTNPCLEESSRILRQLIPRMIDDALKLTVDIIFPPKKKAKVSIPVESPQKKLEAVLDDSCMNIQIGSEPGIGSSGPTKIHPQGEVRTIKVINQTVNESQSLEQDQVLIKKENQLLSAHNSNFTKSKYQVNDYADTENMWELIYQLKST